jgi:hypothetical protein
MPRQSSIISANDIEDGDVIYEDDAEYVVIDVHERVSGVYVIAQRDDVAGEDEFVFQHDEPVEVQS